MPLIRLPTVRAHVALHLEAVEELLVMAVRNHTLLQICLLYTSEEDFQDDCNRCRWKMDAPEKYDHKTQFITKPEE